MISGFAILVIGFFLGMRHATDPDHVIAVSTIVTRERSLSKAALIGALWGVGHTLTILVNRHELTGADREWADRYDPGDVIRYTRGSSRVGVKEGEYATVVNIDRPENLLTVRREDGKQITYDPKRLQGVNVYHREERQFSQNERVQFTAPFKRGQVANRELGHIEKIDSGGNLRLRFTHSKLCSYGNSDSTF